MRPQALSCVYAAMFDSPRSLAVIGLGTFGAALACRARSNGARVVGIDIAPEKADRYQGDLDSTICADAREKRALRECALDDQDAVVIAVGSDVEASLLAAHHARALGAKQLFVKAQSDTQEDILRSIGVDAVLRPEIDAGRQLADHLTDADAPSRIERLVAE